MQRHWEEATRDTHRGRWGAIYATMNSGGDIMISRFTYAMLEDAEAVTLLYDRVNSTIGIKPAKRSTLNAYPTGPRGRHGGRIIRAYRMAREFGIRLNETVRFEYPEIDPDGTLVLDLRRTRPAARPRQKRVA